MTIAPAKWLRMEDKIGTLSPGSWADVTVIDSVPGRWTYRDQIGGSVVSSLPSRSRCA